ncbi:TonB-dependent receptor [Terriglobus roseus]|uniref:TonB-dependent Receptor Plug Domain n=1 Tax=Terriglobus roseus TaxID=392734 RepID=A0A1H4MUM3_9BACT|nr:carboxypeptidase regulatory-like domain-containing protein [Terriglobus roseus]SEB86729.1 TonB-dependent Receptor Plug Domain [Terriglobus roseus]
MYSSRFLAKSLFAASITIPLALSAVAQSDSASLSGTVTDASGALVPNAKATIHSDATGADSVVTTNASGNFTVPNVRPGSYTIKIEVPGFQTTTLNAVNVDPSIGKHVDISMKVGDAGTSVSVEANINTVQTESAVVGQLVTQEQVKSIQLNGRNPLYLAQLEPGVVRNSPMASFSFGLDNGLNIGGSRSQESIITLDGAPMVRTRSNGTSVGVADVDSTSQVQILSSSYQAEYGRTAGGQVRMVPKSGTQQFHATAYEYLRNNFFNANTWQRKLPTNALNIQQHPAAFRYNQFGYNINGPLFIPKVFNKSKEHLFFLFAQEFVKYNNADTVFRKVPTLLMRQGDYSELLGQNIFYGTPQQIYDPNTGTNYTGNKIPTAQLSANGTGLLNAFPTPNASGSNYNWVDADTERQTQRKDTLVVDYVPAEAHRLRLSILNYNYYDYSPHYGNFNRNPRIFTRPNQIGVFHYQWTISPSMVNEAVVSAASDHVTIDIDKSSGLYDRTRYGINYPFLYSAATKTIPNKIPTVQLTGFDLLDGGPYPSRSGGIVYSFADNLTKVWGNHTTKFGFVAEYAGENNFDQITVSNTPGSTNNQNGKFTFTDLRGLSGTRPRGEAGVAAANASLGLFDSYGEIGQRSYTLYRAWMYEGFAQDAWHVSPNLVIEAGVRYSFYNPYYAKWGNQSVFSQTDYNAGNAASVNRLTGVVTGTDQQRLNGVVIPGSGFPSSANGHVAPEILANGYAYLFRGYSSQYSPTVKTNIQPRFGITYQAHPGTVIRAGGGRYVQRLGITDNVFTGGNTPFQPSSTVQLGSADAPGGVGTNNFPLNYSSQAYNYPSPEAYNWNLTLEQELPVGILTVAYAGRKGIHLEEILNVNQLQPGTVQANPGVNQDALRPYKGFSNINQATNGGASNYHSLQVNLRRRLTKGLLFGVAYTWSKAMDFGSANGTNLPNAYDKNGFYGLSDFDRRHVFLANLVYNIDQFNHSTHFINRAAFGHWQFSGTAQAQTGAPLSVTTTTDFAGVGPGSGNQLVPLVHRMQTLKSFAGQSGSSPWFDTSAYPATRTNAFLLSNYAGQFAPRGSRNQIVGPGFQSYSAALNKSWTLAPGHENAQLTFRAESFNFLNKPSADNPDLTFTSGTFGQSKTKGGTYDLARQFQFSLRVSF